MSLLVIKLYYTWVKGRSIALSCYVALFCSLPPSLFCNHCCSFFFLCVCVSTEHQRHTRKKILYQNYLENKTERDTGQAAQLKKQLSGSRWQGSSHAYYWSCYQHFFVTLLLVLCSLKPQLLPQAPASYAHEVNSYLCVCFPGLGEQTSFVIEDIFQKWEPRSLPCPHQTKQSTTSIIKTNLQNWE